MFVIVVSKKKTEGERNQNLSNKGLDVLDCYLEFCQRHVLKIEASASLAPSI